MSDSLSNDSTPTGRVDEIIVQLVHAERADERTDVPALCRALLAAESLGEVHRAARALLRDEVEGPDA